MTGNKPKNAWTWPLVALSVLLVVVAAGTIWALTVQ